MAVDGEPGPAGGGPRDIRVCVLGDSFVTGVGDPKTLGWLGRVLARTATPEVAVTAYNLGVRGDSSADVLARWREETARRWSPEAESRLVVAMGYNDIGQGLSLARTRLNLANIVDDAVADGLQPFVVGPPPSMDPLLNERLRVLVQAQADVCDRRSVPYVDCFTPLTTHEQWFADLGPGDGCHPGQAGYSLLAWLVLHSGWPGWLGLDPVA